ncbi:unnamed protein product [Rotaria sp. Silwood2]|nr:unnamed protein product [Rotaria sp. Silwood2]
MILWGTVTIGTAFVKNARELFAVRFLLGVVVAAYFSGITIYISLWYRKTEQTMRISLFAGGAIIGGTFGAAMARLSNSEKELLTNILRDDAGMTNGETDSGSRVSGRQVRYVIMDWRIYLYVLIGIGLLSAMQCLTLFLPSLFDDKFNDNKLLTAITFSRKYYPKDSAFTDKFSLLLANGLRRFNVHQIVRITTFAAKNQYSKFSVVT